MFLKENNDLIIGEQNQPSYKKEREGGDGAGKNFT